MRKIGILLVMLAVFMVSACSSKGISASKLVSSLSGKAEEISEYQVAAVMELNHKDTFVKYDVTIDYLKPDLYKVTLKNLENNNIQIIVKNDTGVYVLTPALNKSFKFQSDWPFNTSHAYLLQSLVKDMVNDKNAIITSTETEFVVETKMSHKTNATLKTQKITIDKKTLMPKEVIVYDEQKTPQIKVTFNEFNLSPKLKKIDFDVDKSMSTILLEMGEGAVSYERELTAPTYSPAGSYLENEIVSSEKSIKYYAGEVSFTIVQQFVEASATSGSTRIYGEPVQLNHAVGALTDNSITWHHNGVEYMIFSTNLTPVELVKVANSFAYSN